MTYPAQPLPLDDYEYDFNCCNRCRGTGVDPDYGNGLYGTMYCRRCAGAGTREAGPT